MKAVCILGEGAWGTAVATVLAHNNIPVTLWCYDAKIAHAIKTTRFNDRYLPGIYLDERIESTTTLQAVHDATVIFEAIPVQFLRAIVSDLKTYVNKETPWVILSKGIEQKTLLLPTQIVDDALGFIARKAVLLGPSYAYEVARKQCTAVTLGSTDHNLGNALQELLTTDYFKTYLSTDIIGAQVGAALKNVIALAIGMLDGAGYGDNAKSFIITRGLQEMVTIAKTLGGKAETLYELSGVGDLVLTALGKHSKNQEVGRRLGAGKSLEEIVQELKVLPEGINTVQSVYQFMQQHSLNLPICNAVYDCIFNKKPIKDLIQQLR